MQTTNVVDENIKKIGELFPNCLTETLDENGRTQTAIDFDQLRQELSKDIVEGPEERYQFSWPDKRNAIRLANAPTSDTLRPCREESVDFDNTQNLYIEGDNLEVLKLLRENYLGKVKMIYIDPPYNTGNDFVYNDDFVQSAGEYVHNSGQEDEEGNRLVANTESNGRFHTDWLNMIYPRLKVAKDLLSDDGVIFISIDDGEIRNIKYVCDEIYGEHNCISIIPRIAKKGSNQGTHFRPTKDYILCYAKKIENLKSFVDRNIIGEQKNYPYTEKDGRKYRKAHSLFQASLDPLRGCVNQRYYIEAPDGTLVIPPGDNYPSIAEDGSNIPPVTKNDKVWRWSKDSYLKKKSIIMFDKSPRSPLVDSYGNHTDWNVYEKKYEDEESEKFEGALPNDVIYDYINSMGTSTLHDLGLDFSFSKPYQLIKYLIEITDKENDIIILDFFSGSATTAHAVMEYNAEDGGKRKFIMVQLNESLPEGTPEFKSIPEIAKERIRRAGKKIKVDSPLTTQNLDTGFRVLKLDSSNMQDVYYTPADFDERDLFEDNIKPDRTEEDLLFQAMIELGIELSAKIEKREIAGKTVWSVSDGYLMACFDENVNETTIKEIAKQHPYYFVMRDSSLATDNVADNFEQIWEEYSKDTERRIL